MKSKTSPSGGVWNAYRSVAQISIDPGVGAQQCRYHDAALRVAPNFFGM
jgi:hypothetical protein